mgnify:CR=1 FL=1
MQIFKDLWKIISTEDFRNYLLQGFGNTLLITIGNGKGDNWWCVLFPNFCHSSI